VKKVISIIIALVGLSVVAVDADARRLGGGRNTGMQRSAPADKQAAPKAPVQQQQAAPAAPAQQPAGASKWLGPLTGFALGAAFFGLFLNNGVAGVLAGLLLLALLVAGLAFAARALRGRAAQQPLQYAAAGAGAGPSYPSLPGGAGANSAVATTGHLPAGFDASGFLRHARLNFVKLQQAHDRKDLSQLSDFLSPDLYREIEADIRAAGDTPQQTEVLTLEAEIVEVAEEAGSYIVSVRFSGLIREAAGEEGSPFREIWHLEKPASGRGGWMVAGIQQA
jgi:predicted lipid-binding transport protein (Tim44 family)